MEFFNRLLRKRSSPDQVVTAPLDPRQVYEPVAAERPKRILVGTAQSTGIERSHNEDTLFVLHGSSSSGNRQQQFGLFIVADGMGGHRAGEIASAISVRKVAQQVIRDSLLQLISQERNAETPALQDMVREALEAANEAVVKRVPGGGTTLTAAVVLGHNITFGHVGDSRAYIISERETNALTRDHSLVERLLELGQLTEDEAASHPQRNVLYRAIGQGANLEVDVSSQPAPSNGYLLLCSDGLWGVIEEEQIKDIVLTSNDPQEACEQLVQAANAAGGPDNITVILVYFP
jgi:protein phosphatase